ncbi:ABC transporter ATP-binding protein [Desulfopila sp. IMCC35008]|uniref:ABC transporter ATP-binding protein n=1 Tax=Desulfopila sp. IMCC35008 TaxID=2653858 RepID=UPI0013D153EA|nr:ABC transporter ATP-binding protein [Desulfopila sp. IMCC35008]
MTVIQIENLWKEYRLGVIGHGTLTHDLQSWWAKVRKKEDPNAKIEQRTPGQDKQIEGDRFWALRGINLKVSQGDIVGIIGKNGAGKSTLLKVLSRVTAPTRGDIKVKGRIASLLEVGTGFHPELTGRENIFLNGAILGMSRYEIRAKLDEIVSFSGIEDFIDTPVKRYSSGMYVRLAFAVAAHLEPEILIIDEVLAVGDAEFQKKCLGKMSEVSKEGRTVLFVSHNLAAVKNLCSRAILINNGEIETEGETISVVEEYTKTEIQTIEGAVKVFDADDAKAFQLTEVRLVDDIGETITAVDCDQDFNVECSYIVRETVPGLYGYATISTMDGTLVLESDSFDSQPNVLDNLTPGEARLIIRVPARSLSPGRYQVYLNFTSINSFSGFNVDSPGVVGQFTLYDNTSSRGNNRKGYFSTGLNWTTASISK